MTMALEHGAVMVLHCGDGKGRLKHDYEYGDGDASTSIVCSAV